MIDTYNNERPLEEKQCAFCGEPSEGTFCSKDCRKGYEND